MVELTAFVKLIGATTLSPARAPNNQHGAQQTTPLVTVRGTISGVLLDFLIDSGSSVTIIRFDAWSQFLDAKRAIFPEQRNVHALNGGTLNVEGIFSP